MKVSITDLVRRLGNMVELHGPGPGAGRSAHALAAGNETQVSRVVTAGSYQVEISGRVDHHDPGERLVIERKTGTAPPSPWGAYHPHGMQIRIGAALLYRDAEPKTQIRLRIEYMDEGGAVHHIEEQEETAANLRSYLDCLMTEYGAHLSNVERLQHRDAAKLRPRRAGLPAPDRDKGLTVNWALAMENPRAAVQFALLSLTGEPVNRQELYSRAGIRKAPAKLEHLLKLGGYLHDRINSRASGPIVPKAAGLSAPPLPFGEAGAQPEHAEPLRPNKYAPHVPKRGAQPERKQCLFPLLRAHVDSQPREEKVAQYDLVPGLEEMPFVNPGMNPYTQVVKFVRETWGDSPNCTWTAGVEKSFLSRLEQFVPVDELGDVVKASVNFRVSSVASGRWGTEFLMSPLNWIRSGDGSERWREFVDDPVEFAARVERAAEAAGEAETKSASMKAHRRRLGRDPEYARAWHERKRASRTEVDMLLEMREKLACQVESAAGSELGDRVRSLPVGEDVDEELAEIGEEVRGAVLGRAGASREECAEDMGLALGDVDDETLIIWWCEMKGEGFPKFPQPKPKPPAPAPRKAPDPKAPSPVTRRRRPGPMRQPARKKLETVRRFLP